MKEIKELLAITKTLRGKYGRTFTLDGKLVGDIGEVLVAQEYGLELLPESSKIHDAIETSTNRKVQIKSSFKGYSYFPGEGKEIPDYFISVNITEEGNLEEMFNGPGEFIRKEYIIARKLKSTGEYSLSRGVLEKLNKKVERTNKIGVNV